MVVGSGLIAKSFFHYKNNDDVIIFASGVSNSLNNIAKEFEREQLLLEQHLNEKQENQKLIYFSTFNVFDPSLAENNYVIHKKKMESILNQYPNTIIIRLPIILANSDNPNTLLNFFINNIKQKTPFKIYSKSVRYLISIEDAVKTCDNLINKKGNCSVTYNISFPQPLSIEQMVHLIENELNLKGNYQISDTGAAYSVSDIFFEKSIGIFDSCSDYFSHCLKRIELNQMS